MTAFRASYADLKIVKTRGVCQVVLEIPLEQADAAIKLLGGVPRPDREVWVGVARLAEEAAPEPPQPEEPAKERRRFDTLPLPQQAALLCQDERFQEWAANLFGRGDPSCMEANETGEWDIYIAKLLRDRCGVGSRSQILPGTAAALRFLALRERYMIDTGQWTAP